MLVLMYLERNREGADGTPLWKRYGTLAVVGTLSLVPTLVYMLVTGQGPMEAMQGNAWQVDFLVAVTVPYAALSPVWNVSGHVIFALMPTLYLTLVDRRFWPLLLVPAVMLPNRIYLDAHTWAQTIGGLLVSSGLVLLVFERRRNERLTARFGQPQK